MELSEFFLPLSLVAVALVVLLALFGLTSLALKNGWPLSRLTIASLTAAGLFALLWLLNYHAISTDWGNAGGFMDCWPSCTFVQDAVGTIFWFVPFIIGFLLVGALLSGLWARSGRRSRRMADRQS